MSAPLWLNVLLACASPGPAPGDDSSAADSADTVDTVDSADTADTCPDADGDSHADATCGGDDCDDAARAVHPGAVEAWPTAQLGFGDTAAALDLARRPDGSLHLVWWDSADDTLHYATDTTGAWVDETAAGGATCCAVRIDTVDTSLSVLAWASAGVTYAVGNAGAWTVRPVWSSPDVAGAYLDLAVHDDEEPVLAYGHDDVVWTLYPERDGAAEAEVGRGTFAMGLAMFAAAVPVVLTTRVDGPDQWVRVGAVADGSGWLTEDLGGLNSYTGLRAIGDDTRVVAAWDVPLELQSGLGFAAYEAGTWTTALPVDGTDADVFPDLDVALGTDELARVAFVDRSVHRLTLATEGTPWTTAQLGRAREVGPALALDAADTPVIAFADPKGLAITGPGPDGVDQDCDGAD